MDSILQSIKKMLGLPSDYGVFDPDVIMNINMVFNILNQLGVGPEEGFSIYDESATWEDYLGDCRQLEMVKTYVYLKVKQIFDPGTSSALSTAIENQIAELEWRISVQVDPGKKEAL